MADAPVSARPPRRLNRARLALILAPIVVATSAGLVGNALFPALLRDHKLLLVALDGRNRQLVPVAHHVALVAFIVVATVRRCWSDPSFYILGRVYGDDAVRWLERRAGEAGAVVRTLERLFSRVGPVLVFVFPGAMVCVLAGATGMSPTLFAILNVTGTIAMVAAMWALAGVFEGPVGSFTGFVSDNAVWLTALTVVLTAVYLVSQRRRSRISLSELAALEED